MSLFRVYVDGALFYHPHMSKLAITDAYVIFTPESDGFITISKDNAGVMCFSLSVYVQLDVF